MRISLLFLLFFGMLDCCRADGGRLAIFEFSYQGILYYTTEFVYRDISQDGLQFVFYTSDSLTTSPIRDFFYDVVIKYWPEDDEVRVAARLEELAIDFSLWKDIEHGEKTSILLLKDIRVYNGQFFMKGKMHFIRAYMLGSGGFIHSRSLSENDEVWLNSDQIIELFSIREIDGVCDLTFYGIRDNQSARELKQIETYLRKYFERVGYIDKTIEDYLDELHQRRIIMLGFCSC